VSPEIVGVETAPGLGTTPFPTKFNLLGVLDLSNYSF
jgi:hypothetical protein